MYSSPSDNTLSDMVQDISGVRKVVALVSARPSHDAVAFVVCARSPLPTLHCSSAKMFASNSDGFS